MSECLVEKFAWGDKLKTLETRQLETGHWPPALGGPVDDTCIDCVQMVAARFPGMKFGNSCGGLLGLNLLSALELLVLSALHWLSHLGCNSSTKVIHHKIKDLSRRIEGILRDSIEEMLMASINS